MLRLFTENRALTVFLLPFFTAGYVLLNSFFSYIPVTNDLDFGLFGTYQIDHLLIKQIAGGVILFLNAVGINLIFNRQNFYEKTTYLPAFIYIVWMSFFKEMYNPDGFLLSHTAFILMFSQLVQLNQNEDGRKLVFNAAFLAGVAVGFHLTAVIVLLFLFIMVWTARPFVFRESLLLLAGFTTPLLYAGVLNLFHPNMIQQKWEITALSLYGQQLSLLMIAALVFLFIVVSFFGMRIKLQKSSIRFRKITRMLWIFFFLTLFIGILDLLISQQLEYFSLLFVVIPFFGFFAFSAKSLSGLTNALFLITLICSILKFFLQ